jgi:serine/threonine-protein kinase
MGTVYLGRLLSNGEARIVAMKVLHPHLASNADMVAMFLDEARVATRLRHPNLVRVIDMDLVGEELVIVMEYVEGTTLGAMQSAQRQRGQYLPIGVSVRILCDALAGLEEVHGLKDEKGEPLGLVHRDASPHNLLVGSDGIARVTDFGVALAVGRLAFTRPDGTVKGKLQYLAPEQVARRPLDRRVDVFAAGIVLWECLTGERLFEAASEAETVTRVLRDPISPPSMHRPEVSTELDETCLRALERDPDRRFQTAAEFVDALRGACENLADANEVGRLVCDLASESIRRQRESLARATRKASALPGHRARIVLAVGLGCVVVGGAVVPLLLSSRGRPSPPLPSSSGALAAAQSSLSPPAQPSESAHARTAPGPPSADAVGAADRASTTPVPPSTGSDLPPLCGAPGYPGSQRLRASDCLASALYAGRFVNDPWDARILRVGAGSCVVGRSLAIPRGYAGPVCGCSRTTRTEHGAWLTIFAAVVPSKRSKPP